MIAERATVQVLFVLFGFALETTRSSDMVHTSEQVPPGAYRLRLRREREFPDRDIYSKAPLWARQYRNWSMFLSQLLPPWQKRKHAAPARPSEKVPGRLGTLIHWSISSLKASD